MDNKTTTSGGSKNVLGADVEIKGELRFSGEMTLDGKVEGEIRGEGSLTLGEGSVVNGNIETQSAIVRGKINGNIVTRDKLELKAKTELFGDIKAPRLSIEEGVTFVGRVDVNPNKIASTASPGRIEAPKGSEGPKGSDASKAR